MENIDIDENREQGRTVAILSYMWLPGWIIALVLNGQSRSSLGSFHLRQSLGLMLLLLILIWIIRYRLIVVLLQVAASLYGIISAARYEKTPIPGIGEYFQDWFKTL